MMRGAFWLVPAFGAFWGGCLPAEEAPFYFTNFEDVVAWPGGELKTPRAGWQVTEPAAWIRNGDMAKGSRHLEVSGAVNFLGERFTGDGQTWLEIWVRPRAMRMTEGAELLDFDGAVLAFFEDGKGKGEWHGLHITEDGAGHWIATGVKAPLSDGAAAHWHCVGIIQNWAERTWDLVVDGRPVLTGMGRGECAAGRHFELWFYGHGDGFANRYDDVLVSPVPPAVLEAQQVELRKDRQAARTELQGDEKRVGAGSSEGRRRKHQLPRPQWQSRGRAEVLSLALEVVGGGRHIGQFESRNDQGAVEKFALYSPGYDAEGKPKPLEILIRCDAKLEAGARLGDIEWAVTALEEQNQSGQRVIAWGDFSTGPGVKTTLPSEWSNKPLAVHCGSLGLKEKFSSRN